MSDEAISMRSGLITATLTAGILSLVIFLSPQEWRLLVAHVATASLLAFWVSLIGRLTGSDVLNEFQLKYPDFRQEPSLHQELAAIREAIEGLQRREL